MSSSPRAHSILLTCRCTSSVREARKPLRDNNHGQTASHLCHVLDPRSTTSSSVRRLFTRNITLTLEIVRMETFLLEPEPVVVTGPTLVEVLDELRAREPLFGEHGDQPDPSARLGW